MTIWGRPRENWRWWRPASIWRPRRSRMRSTRPSRAAKRAAKEYWLAAAAQAHPQRAHQADEGRGLRHGLSLRPRPAGSVFGPGLFSTRRWAVIPSTIRQASGFEREISKRLDYWAKIRRERRRRLISVDRRQQTFRAPAGCRHVSMSARPAILPSTELFQAWLSMRKNACRSRHPPVTHATNN